MRVWQFWWRTLVYNPPFLVELVMTGLAICFSVFWAIMKDRPEHGWPYLVLSSSYAMGSAMSMWVRESITPSPQSRMVQALAVLLLIYGVCCYTEPSFVAEVRK